MTRLITVASIVLVLLDVADMRETGRSGSPLLAYGVRCWLQPLAGETMGRRDGVGAHGEDDRATRRGAILPEEVKVGTVTTRAVARVARTPQFGQTPTGIVASAGALSHQHNGVAVQ